MSEPALVEAVVVEATMTADEARVHTQKLKNLISEGLRLHEHVAEELDIAWTREAWRALGYKSWDEYCAGEFADIRASKLNPKRRKQLVAQLTSRSGMSSRAIAAGLGVDQKTVVRDRKDAQSKTDGGEESASPPVPRQTIRGTDGKNHPVQRPTPPRRTSLNEVVREQYRALDQAIAILEEAQSGGEWRTHAQEVAGGFATPFIALAERLSSVADNFMIVKRVGE